MGTEKHSCKVKEEDATKKCVIEILKYKGVCEIWVTLSVCTLKKCLGFRENQ